VRRLGEGSGREEDGGKTRVEGIGDGRGEGEKGDGGGQEGTIEERGGGYRKMERRGGRGEGYEEMREDNAGERKESIAGGRILSF